MSSNESIVLHIKQGENLKNELFENIYKLLYYFCRRYINFAEKQGYETDDLLSVSWFGVEKAIKDYEPDKGLKFSSYLQHHINNEITEFLGIRNGKRKETVLSLDKPIGDMDDITLADTVADSGAVKGFEKAEKYDYYNVLMNELEKLLPEQTEILKRHFFDNETITHIAQTKSVSIENIAAKKRKALSVLRRNRKIEECYYDEFAYMRTSVKHFNNTWTSSTEWAVLKLAEKERMSK